MKPFLSFFINYCIIGYLAAQQGLKAEYFNGTNFNEKVATQTDRMIDLSWNDEPPVPGLDPHYCSIRWTGRLTAPETGTYTFSARVDDGIRVWVGGTPCTLIRLRPAAALMNTLEKHQSTPTKGSSTEWAASTKNKWQSPASAFFKSGISLPKIAHPFPFEWSLLDFQFFRTLPTQCRLD